MEITQELQTVARKAMKLTPEAITNYMRIMQQDTGQPSNNGHNQLVCCLLQVGKLDPEMMKNEELIGIMTHYRRWICDDMEMYMQCIIESRIARSQCINWQKEGF